MIKATKKTKTNAAKYVAVAALAFGLTLSAQAIRISGDISFSGGPMEVNTGDLSTGTAITGFGTVTTTDVSGDYASVTSGTLVNTTTGFQFIPSLAPSPAVDVWRFVFDTRTYSFDLGLIQGVSQGIVNGTRYLQITGTGTLHITGLEDTPGSYLLTADSANSMFSFSSHSAAIPDGGMTLLLLGAAFSGLTLLRRKLA